MSSAVRVLLVSGSTRGASTNTAALRTARLVAPQGVTAELYDGLADLPAFIPEDEPASTHPAVRDLRQRLDAADLVLFCTPEYAGALPGSFKNLIDWTVGTGELNRKPVAWINVAAPGRGGGALAELATVLGYVDAIVIEPGGLHLPVARAAVGPDGTVDDPQFRTELREALRRIVEHWRELPPEPGVEGIGFPPGRQRSPAG
jgi:chromate reductase